MDNKAYVFALLAALGGVAVFLYSELNKIGNIQAQKSGEELWLTRWMNEREKRVIERDQFIDRYMGLRDTQIERLENRVTRLEDRVGKMK